MGTVCLVKDGCPVVLYEWVGECDYLETLRNISQLRPLPFPSPTRKLGALYPPLRIVIIIILEIKRLPPNRGLGWDILRSAALVGTRIWFGVSWFQWQSVELRLDRHSRATGNRS